MVIHFMSLNIPPIPLNYNMTSGVKVRHLPCRERRYDALRRSFRVEISRVVRYLGFVHEKFRSIGYFATHCG
jgi:hypothetical protein